jgi:hypothetical protein
MKLAWAAATFAFVIAALTACSGTGSAPDAKQTTHARTSSPTPVAVDYDQYYLPTVREAGIAGTDEQLIDYGKTVCAAIRMAGSPAAFMASPSATAVPQPAELLVPATHTFCPDYLAGAQMYGAPEQVPAKTPMPTPDSRVPQMTYAITGDGGSASITWNSQDGTEQATNASLPWSLTMDVVGFKYVSAQNLDGASITCSIRVDGKVIAQNTSTGQYGIVVCHS